MNVYNHLDTECVDRLITKPFKTFHNQYLYYFNPPKNLPQEKKTFGQKNLPTPKNSAEKTHGSQKTYRPKKTTGRKNLPPKNLPPEKTYRPKNLPDKKI